MKKLVEKLLSWCKKEYENEEMRGKKHGSGYRGSRWGKPEMRKGCCLQRLRKRWMKLFSQRLSNSWHGRNYR